MLVNLIGDIHAKVNSAEWFPDNSIQLGDFNLLGYDSWKPGKRVYFIDGNHDHFPSLDTDAETLQEVAKNLLYIPRGFVSGQVLFIGGAESIDRHLRTAGRDWFSEESISQKQFERAMAAPRNIDVVLSHTCPAFLLPHILSTSFQRKGSEIALEEIWKRFRPSLWVFGHFHTSFDLTWHGTRFICLSECERKAFDIPLEKDFWK